MHRPLFRIALALAAMAFVLPALAAPPAPAPTAIRTLDEAIQAALRFSPALQQTRERYVRTQKTIAQILAIRQPQVSAGATYSRLFNAGSGFGGAGGASGQQIQNPFATLLQGTPPGSTPVQLSSGSLATSAGSGVTRGRQTGDGDSTDGDSDGNAGGSGGFSFGSSVELNQQSLRASVTQVIDITGTIRTAQQIGDLELQIQALEMERSKQEVVLGVRNGYFNVLRTEGLVKVAEASVAQSEEQLRVAEAQKRAGTAAEFDVLRARTQLANNRQSFLSARNQLTIARNAFAHSLGIDPSTPVELSAPAETPPLPELDEAKLLAAAFRDRPEARQVELSLRKAKKNTRLSGRGLDPSLAASITGSYNPNPAFIGDRQTGAFGLSLSVPLSDGGAARASRAAAQSDERLAEIQQEQYRRGIQAEIQQAIVAVRDADERAQAAWASVEQAREAYRLAGVRYRAGVDTQLSVSDAQTALTQAETNVVNARYDYLNALARLRRAVGTSE